LNDFHDFSGGGGEKKTPTEAKGKVEKEKHEGTKGTKEIMPIKKPAGKARALHAAGTTAAESTWLACADRGR
jgi:hypothetical protein